MLRVSVARDHRDWSLVITKIGDMITASKSQRAMKGKAKAFAPRSATRRADGGDHAADLGDHLERNTQYAALEPISMGLQRLFGSTQVDVARGLAVRHDHGTQYVSDHFQRQLRFWGIAPSYAFVGEPQTNGVAERFIRTTKEQVIHGRVYRNVQELRRAVAAFVERYNAQWLVEKLGFISPNQARHAREPRLAA